jgi:ABC-type uncharacterized transport system permease subunit
MLKSLIDYFCRLDRWISQSLVIPLVGSIFYTQFSRFLVDHRRSFQQENLELSSGYVVELFVLEVMTDCVALVSSSLLEY